MELTKLINDVLSTFVCYIVDEGADPGAMPQIHDYLTKYFGVGNIDVNAITEHMEQLSGEIVAMNAETRDYLNVYTSNPTEPYSGGVALLAAEDADKANALLEDLRDGDWCGYDYPKIVKGLRFIGEPEVIFNATYRE